MKKVFTTLFVLVSLGALAQQVQESGWFASFNTVRLRAKTSLHAEFQLRSTDGASSVQTILPRLGLNYHLNKIVTLSGGYAWIPNRVTTGGHSELLAEHRLWQQLIIMQPLMPKGMSLQHRFRFEERWLPQAQVVNGEIEQQGSAFATRLRYFARTIIPLKKQGGSFVRGTFAALQEEIFFNTSQADQVNGYFFDQNRCYGAIGYRASSKFDLELGYMNQYIKRRSYQHNVTNHILQLAVYTRF